MKFFILLYLFLSVSFSTETPKWIVDVSSYCKQDDICSVGIGDDDENAKNDARSRITKYFEINIQKKENYKLKMSDFKIYYPLILEEIDFLKNTKIDNTYYFLARLNKKNAAKIISNKIHDIDREIETIIKNKEKIQSINNLKKIRDEFNKRYFIITKDYISPATILNNTNTLKNIYLTKTTNDYENKIRNYVKDFLQKTNGIKVVDDINNADYLISIFIIKSNLFANVGMKQLYSVKILIKQENSVTNNMPINIVEIGKNESEIEKNVDKIIKVKIKEYLEKTI
ncbi:MAG: hypothetical protein LBC92_04590 [Rickettsiales bacterium]|jgi:hypothetical protein|nr:hypothetical protein [Rickettsiales bacterium]